jgi:hypothetical protein
LKLFYPIPYPTHSHAVPGVFQPCKVTVQCAMNKIFIWSQLLGTKQNTIVRSPVTSMGLTAIHHVPLMWSSYIFLVGVVIVSVLYIPHLNHCCKE